MTTFDIKTNFCLKYIFVWMLWLLKNDTVYTLRIWTCKTNQRYVRHRNRESIRRSKGQSIKLKNEIRYLWYCCFFVEFAWTHAFVSVASKREYIWNRIEVNKCNGNIASKNIWALICPVDCFFGFNLFLLVGIQNFSNFF